MNRHEWLRLLMASDLSPAVKLRGYALFQFANDEGYCWPNQDQIEATIGNKVTGRTSQHIHALARAGWISIGYKTTAGGKSANYTLTTPTNVGEVDLQMWVGSPTNVGSNHTNNQPYNHTNKEQKIKEAKETGVSIFPLASERAGTAHIQEKLWSIGNEVFTTEKAS